MLWYKSWLETRWRFLIGVGLLSISACSTVLYYPEVLKLMPMAGSIDVSGEIGRRIREGVELSRNYDGYIWSQWFGQNVTQLGTLFAILLGSGSPISQGSGGATLFTLSLPASRNRLLGVRTATGLAEWFVIALIPSLVIPLLSPAIGERYSVVGAMVYAACLFVAGAVFFSLAVLLSAMLDDLLRPLLIACSVAVLVALSEVVLGGFARVGPFAVMGAEGYFRGGGLPWIGLALSAVASMAMLYASTLVIARKDF
jgi:hypothetical protein